MTDYASYYTSWRELATSKSEQDAASMLVALSGDAGKFGDAVGASALAAHRRDEAARAALPRAKKALTAKQKREQHLEKMKRVWGVVSDSGASLHNQLSAGDFLRVGQEIPALRSPQQVRAPTWTLSFGRKQASSTRLLPRCRYF